MSVRTIVLTYAPDGIHLSVRYVRKDGPNPSTKGRLREVRDFARSGLMQALEALEGDVVSIGEAGFTQREDVLQLLVPPAKDKTMTKEATA